MKMDGVFISNHLSCNDDDYDHATLAMIELMTRAMGYPTHQLPGKILKKGLTEAGCGPARNIQSGLASYNPKKPLSYDFIIHDNPSR